MSFNNLSKIYSSGHGSIENHKLAGLWGDFEQWFIGSMPIFYPVSLMKNTFRQHGTKQTEESEDVWEGMDWFHQGYQSNQDQKPNSGIKLRKELRRSMQRAEFRLGPDLPFQHQLNKPWTKGTHSLMCTASSWWPEPSKPVVETAFPFSELGLGVILLSFWRITCVCSWITLSAHFCWWNPKSLTAFLHFIPALLPSFQAGRISAEMVDWIQKPQA